MWAVHPKLPDKHEGDWKEINVCLSFRQQRYRPAEIIPGNIIPFIATCEESFYDLQSWSSDLLDDIQNKGNLLVSWH
jgi:hypothetical protein